MKTDKNAVHNQKHLTLSDRIYIEQELLQNSTFRYIGSVLHKDPSTISKEIRKHVKTVAGKRTYGYCYKCKHYFSCDIRGYDLVISKCKYSSYCKNLCKKCWRERPPQLCSIYTPFVCDKPLHAPYACNSCIIEKDCPLSHPIYAPKTAQIAYEKSLTKSRTGINMTPVELQNK